jgi:hypothetical protein
VTSKLPRIASFPVRLALVAVVALAALAAPANGAPNEVNIGNNIFIGPSTVACPGAPVRKLDATQSAAFMQTWFFDSILGHPAVEHPPANVPVCHLKIADRWQTPDARSLLVFYATQGDKVWIGMPPQPIGFGVGVDSEKWIRGSFPQRTKDAIAGHGTLVAVPTVPATTTTVAGKAAAPASSGSDSSTGILVALGAVVVALGLGGWWFVSRRPRTRAPSSS